jgi:signal peptidase I
VLLIGNNYLPIDSAGDISKLSPGKRFKVNAIGFSMRPEIHPGDTLTLKAVTAQEIAVGDIAVFLYNQHLIAHRILRKDSGSAQFLQIGDHQYQPRNIAFDKILAKIVAVERKGKMMNINRLDYCVKGKVIACYLLVRFLAIEFLSKTKKRIFPKGA